MCPTKRGRKCLLGNWGGGGLVKFEESVFRSRELRWRIGWCVCVCASKLSYMETGINQRILLTGDSPMNQPGGILSPRVNITTKTHLMALQGQVSNTWEWSEKSQSATLAERDLFIQHHQVAPSSVVQ